MRIGTLKMDKKPIKIGIWGIGRAGWGMHMPELKQYPDEFQVVAVCDRLPERLKKFGEENPGVKLFENAGDFLADPEIEFVSVAVPSPLHVEFGLRALNAGKYVFLEKPVALTYPDALKLKAATRKVPGKLFFRHNRRFEECFSHIREMIRSGILGDVYEIKMCRHNFDFRSDWQTLIDCGGGQLNNWGPHLIDQALQLLESPVESVWSDLKNIAARGDAEDHLKVILRGTNRRVIDIEISGGVALPSPVYAVYGDRGSLVSEDEQDIKLKYIRPEFKMPDYPASPDTPPMDGSFGGVRPQWIRKTIMTAPACDCKTSAIYHYLYQAIRENRPFPVKTDEAMEVVRITELIKQQNPQFAARKSCD